jgi:hypothetical protein
MAVQRPGREPDHSPLVPTLRMLGVTPFTPEASSGVMFNSAQPEFFLN